MAIDELLIDSMLNNLKTSISRMENMDVTLENILDNDDIQDIVDRRMQIAIESCIDIATHLAAGLDLERKERASDVFLLLSKHKVISDETSQRLAGAVGLRNILVHEYADIDYKLAYKDLKEKLQDLKNFAKEVISFTEKQS